MSDKMTEAARLDEARVRALVETPPFSGLKVTARDRDGNQSGARATFAQRAIPSPTVRGTATSAKYLRRLCMASWRNAVFYHGGGPTDAECEPVNDTARNIVTYYSAHKSHPDLPPSAWDEENGRINAIPQSVETRSPNIKVEPMPYLRTRGAR